MSDLFLHRQPENGARDNSVKIVILVTDGRSDDRVATVEVADKLKAAGVNIFTVGVGDSVDKVTGTLLFLSFTFNFFMCEK